MHPKQKIWFFCDSPHSLQPTVAMLGASSGHVEHFKTDDPLWHLPGLIPGLDGLKLDTVLSINELAKSRRRFRSHLTRVQCTKIALSRGEKCLTCIEQQFIPKRCNSESRTFGFDTIPMEVINCGIDHHLSHFCDCRLTYIE